MNTKHILGAVTIAVIIGGTIYAIKKAKEAEKIEGESISLDEAREIVSKSKLQDDLEESLDEVLEQEVTTPQPSNIISRLPSNDDIYEEIDEEEYDDVYYVDESNNIGYFTEEDSVLRYEPSSLEALNQFKRMELADVEGADKTYQTMLTLFDFEFVPTNDGDEILRTQIIDRRVQFFGFNSKWNQEITYAEVILHYARAAVYNMDNCIGYWVETFLINNELYYHYSNSVIENSIKQLNNHEYFNNDTLTFGLFGLDDRSMDQARNIANRNFDNSVTYEIEFNEFLKARM